MWPCIPYQPNEYVPIPIPLYHPHVQSKMLPLVVILTVTTLLHGVNSHIPPHGLQELTKSIQPLKIIKRQAFNIDGDCIAVKARSLPIACLGKIAAAGEPDESIEYLASIVCPPECGQSLLDVLGECGATAEEVELIASLCRTNRNGDVCYELFDDFIQLQHTDDSTCPSSETCPSSCETLLSDLVTRQGCCLTAFLDFGRIEDPASIALFDEQLMSCSITAPGTCTGNPGDGNNPDDGNNDPDNGNNQDDGQNGSDNNSASAIFFQVSHLALLLALLLTTMLG